MGSVFDFRLPYVPKSDLVSLSIACAARRSLFMSLVDPGRVTALAGLRRFDPTLSQVAARVGENPSYAR